MIRAHFAALIARAEERCEQLCAEVESHAAAVSAVHEDSHRALSTHMRALDACVALTRQVLDSSAAVTASAFAPTSPPPASLVSLALIASSPSSSSSSFSSFLSSSSTSAPSARAAAATALAQRLVLVSTLRDDLAQARGWGQREMRAAASRGTQNPDKITATNYCNNHSCLLNAKTQYSGRVSSRHAIFSLL